MRICPYLLKRNFQSINKLNKVKYPDKDHVPESRQINCSTSKKKFFCNIKQKSQRLSHVSVKNSSSIVFIKSKGYVLVGWCLRVRAYVPETGFPVTQDSRHNTGKSSQILSWRKTVSGTQMLTSGQTELVWVQVL